MDKSSENGETESGFSDRTSEESCHRKDNDFQIREQKHNRDKVKLYPATRLYLEKGEVMIISADKIKDFDASKKKFPYDAYVANGYTSDDEILYEPAAILEVSKNKTELECRRKRWPKPNKRRSDVIYDMAKSDLERQELKTKKSNKKLETNTIVLQKGERSGIVHVKREIQEKIKVLNARKLNFDVEKSAATKSSFTKKKEEEDKDTIIAKLLQELEEKRNKNRVTVTPPATSLSNNNTTVSPVLSSHRPRSSRTQREGFTLAAVTPPTGSTFMISGEEKCIIKANSRDSPEEQSPALISGKSARGNWTVTHVAIPSGMANSPECSEAESPSLISGKPQNIKSTTMITSREKRQKINSEDSVGSSKNKDALPITPQSSKGKKKLKRRQLEFHDDSIAGSSEVHNKSKDDKKGKKKYEKLDDDSIAGSSEVHNKSKDDQKGKKKYERKIKECLYDTDDYNASDLPQKESFTKWDDEELNPDTGYFNKKTMFHIHYGVSVPYKNWKNAIAARSSYSFLRELVVPHVWAQEEFVKRAVQINRTNDSSNRLELTPRKKEAIKKGYVQYLIERRVIPCKVSTKEEKKKRDSRIRKFGRELGIIISQERAKLNVNISNEDADDDVSTESSKTPD